jgi:mono/diheme cytochrome c family protein
MKKNEPGMAYNMKTLNKVFAVLSVIFLFSTIWMVLDDFIRPWKAIQVKSLEIKKQVLTEKVKSMEDSIDGEQVRELQEKIENAKKGLADKEDELEDLEEKLTEAQRKVYVQNMRKGIASSQRNATQFQYEHAVIKGKKNKAKKLKVKFDRLAKEFVEISDVLKGYEAYEKEIQKKIREIKSSVTDNKKELSNLVGAKERLLAAISRTEKNPVWFLRNSPMLDFLDPTLKIHQYVSDRTNDDLYFQQVPTISRCQTCHTFIDQKGYEDQPQPYTTHPKLDELAVGINSAHPAKDFGCVSCHQGEGHRVNDFNSVVHTPQNEEQKQEWIKKYHWHEPHKIPKPMFRLQDTEAACIKCHKGEVRISGGTRVNEGRHLIETYGCYGCHKIDGIAGWANAEKPGPSLKKIKGKISKNFAKNWIWSPHSFNEKSKMPAFFNQSHNSKPEFMKKNIAEVNAMAEYLWNSSNSYKPFQKYKGGSKSRGKELIQTVGCIGCHMVEGLDEPYNTVKNRKGTYLTGSGSKLNPDWLVSWLKKPSHYDPTTSMPSFRLTDKDANDITAYIMSLKNKTFGQLEFQKLDAEIRDELLVEYFSAFETIEAAKKKLAKMDDAERTHELGRRSINKYGCASCHDINGMDNPVKIGPELTKFGSKPVHQLGFGHEKHIEHSRHAWLEAHLERPSRWDVGVPKPFKDLTKMPNFYLSKPEIQKISTYVLGLVEDKVPAKGMKPMNAGDLLAEKGKEVVIKYNCQGCHKIDGWGGYIASAYEGDMNQGPPYLVGQGHRVQADWLYKFLKKVHPIRPYVKIRMPSFNFSNDELNSLVAYFQHDSGQGHFVDKENLVSWKPGERAAAKKIWDELACVTCHTGGFTKETAQAPNLHFVRERLRPSWIQKWLANPMAIQDYTIMPNFWEGGEESAVEGVLGDDPQRQIEAITKYIIEFSYKRSPEPFKNAVPVRL